jgi:drug/metabolite transporter (DMT)-like permease
VTPRVKGELYLLATTVIWGSTFAAAKISMLGMSALSLMAFRFLAASFLLLAIFRESVLPDSWQATRKGAILGSLLFLGFIAQTIGLNYTTAAKSSFITSMMVVFAPFLQVLISRRSPTYGNVVGILVVCGGLWLLTSPEGSGFTDGDLLTLLCAFLFAMYIVYLDVVSRSIPPIQLSFLQVATCALLSWALLLPLETPSLPASGESLLALVYLTVFATVLTTLVQTRFQKETTPTRAAIIFSVEPLFATLFASLMINEVVGPQGIAGGSLIITGILVSELSELLPGLRNPVMRPDAAS